VNKEFKIECPHCKTVTRGFVETDGFTASGDGCDTCGYGSELYGIIKIRCLDCDKIAHEHTI
jgi:phage FluMu protein Com